MRDRVTWSLYGVFAAWGWFLYAFNPSVPLIGDQLGVSAAVAGLHGTALAVGTVLAGLVSAGLVRRVGRRSTLYLGMVAVGVGLTLITASGVLVGTLTGAAVAGAGGTLLVNVANAALNDGHAAAAGAALTEANGLGALVGALAPLTLGAFVAVGIGWQPALLVVGAILCLVAVVLPALPPPTDQAAPGSVGRRLPARYWWALAVLVALIAVEFSYSVWSPTLVAARTGVDVGTATGTLTVLILTLGLGRLVGSRLALRIRPGALLLGAIALTAIGWLVLWTSDSVAGAMTGLAISGVGMALHFPLGVARSLQAAAGRTDLASGRVALGAGVAIGAAPFVLGALTDAVGVVSAFLLVPALLGAAVLLLVGGWLSARGRLGESARPA